MTKHDSDKSTFDGVSSGTNQDLEIQALKESKNQL